MYYYTNSLIMIEQLVATTTTVVWEIFTLKIIRENNFRGVKFLRFRSIREIFLTVDGYNVDERLESFSI